MDSLMNFCEAMTRIYIEGKCTLIYFEPRKNKSHGENEKLSSHASKNNAISDIYGNSIITKRSTLHNKYEYWISK